MRDLLREVQEIIREVLGDGEVVATLDMTADDIEGWDSVMHVHLIVAFERAFEVGISTAEMAALNRRGQTVADLIALLESKLQLQR